MSATPHLVPVPDAEPVQPLFHVGDVVSSVAQLKALPELTIVLADPRGENAYEDSRQLAMQKRRGMGHDLWWYPAWASDWTPSSEESVHRFQIGPFQILWLPIPGATA